MYLFQSRVVLSQVLGRVFCTYIVLYSIFLRSFYLSGQQLTQESYQSPRRCRALRGDIAIFSFLSKFIIICQKWVFFIEIYLATCGSKICFFDNFGYCISPGLIVQDRHPLGLFILRLSTHLVGVFFMYDFIVMKALFQLKYRFHLHLLF